MSKRPLALSLLLGLLLLTGLLGCRRGNTPATPLSAVSSLPPAQILPIPTNVPLPNAPSREEQIRLIMESQKKRVLGRVSALDDIARVSETIRPIVAQAVLQPAAQTLLQQMAQDQGVDLLTMQNRWIDIQEADLLLEAGGIPDAISVSKAVGVAQWLTSTGQGAGLKIAGSDSSKLTDLIAFREAELAWAHHLSRPDAKRDAPNTPNLTTEQAKAKIPILQQEIETYKAQRKALDERFDPQKAIFTQTLYLLKLYTRFPSPDWIFQAYHGGEGGVTKLLRLGLGSRRHGNSTDAIRTGNLGNRLTYEDYYLDLNPVQQRPALLYLLGRSDHHRYYWWKIRVAAEVLKAYRERRTELAQDWRNLYPGRSRDVLWYPTAHQNADPNRVLPLRAETEAVFQLVKNRYEQIGGTEKLTPVGLDLTAVERAKQKQAWLQKHPPKPSQNALPPFQNAAASSFLPPGLPSLDFDYHGTGIAVDMAVPRNPAQRALLEHALSQFADQGVLSYLLEKEYGTSRFHLLPNPRHADILRVLNTILSPR